MTDFDIIIVGSGPAGVSAASVFAGTQLKVLIVDGGQTNKIIPPTLDYLNFRMSDIEPISSFIGTKQNNFNHGENVTPKLTIPTQYETFSNFNKINKIDTDGFLSVGSLAVGGLSNAWGCGVARLSEQELNAFSPFQAQMLASYKRVSERMGISGQVSDDLSDYIGLDEWSLPPLPLDNLNSYMLNRYNKQNKKDTSLFKLGRSRVAALSHSYNNRLPCIQMNNCLWGCSRRSLYNAADELKHILLRCHNIKHTPGFIVEKVESTSKGATILGFHKENKYRQTFTAKKVLLAAGTIASSALVLRAMKNHESIPIAHNPSAIFLLSLPKFFGISYQPAFGLGQLSFCLEITKQLKCFGSTFSTSGLPLTSFLKHLPCSTKTGQQFLKSILPGCLVANIFLPSLYSKSRMRLMTNGRITILGGYDETIDKAAYQLKTQLRHQFSKVGGYMMPFSFKLASVGSDIHYAATLPMKLKPKPGQTNHQGEVMSLANIHVIDGSCLPVLTEKPLTMSLMANADRIAQCLLKQL